MKEMNAIKKKIAETKSLDELVKFLIGLDEDLNRLEVSKDNKKLKDIFEVKEDMTFEEKKCLAIEYCKHRRKNTVFVLLQLIQS